MKQTLLSQFFITKEVKPPPFTPTTKSKSGAKETFTPLFLRPCPDIPKYNEQLQNEFDLIDANGFVPVFLQVKTILELIQLIGEETKKPIPHIIRGSAGSSLICFLLGITHIDPLLHGIQLARFMNWGRKDIPDIDIDVPYNRRDEIYGRIAKTWPGMVARISNHVKYTHKTALREVIQDMCDLKVSPPALRKRDYDIRSFLPEKEDQVRAKEEATKKVGKHKHFSQHCAGIVIFESEGEVPQELILKPIEAAGIPLAQIKLDKDETEDAGYIKIDVLSNRGLAQIADICGDRPFTAYPSRDPATERIFEKGWTIGITFGESRGMRKLFMEMKTTCVRDVAVALALIRPAAAAEGRKQEFLTKWKRDSSKEKMDDPLLRPIIFDDDAICKIRRALGCDVAKADAIRKQFAKGNAKARIDFRLAMIDKGHSKEVIDSVIDDLNQLVYYSFCKSHAVSYAQLVWALAYWKAHRVHEFWVAALNHCKSEYRKWVHYREARCSGLQLTLQPPPYTLGKSGEKGEPTLQSKSPGQSRLTPLTPLEEFRLHGYWTSADFMPTCGLWRSGQKTLDAKQTVKFRGLIACGRTVTRDWGACTLICIGVDNREYVDLAIPNKHRSDLFRYAAVEGTGLLTLRSGIETVEVQSIRGVSLKSLV